MAKDRRYMCIDLKSFYASVECVERGLDPITAKLVVADPERTAGTICLAVTPAMKALGVRNRCRVFEIPPNIDYIIATPRMALYIEYSAQVYSVYLKYVAPADIHPYSIDEVFMDITDYLSYRNQTAEEFALMIKEDVFKTVGITAACGVGTNLYLAKIAMDILAKRSPNGIASINEADYRRLLWGHKPLTDFWRIGEGTARRLERMGALTMGEVAKLNEDAMYRTFGIDAELLIDHAWGRESTTIADIKAYKPKTRCLSSGQVLPRAYSFEEGRTIVREMAEAAALDMFGAGLSCRGIALCLSYGYSSPVPPAKGSVSFAAPSASMRHITDSAEHIYERIADRRQGIRKVNITLDRLTDCPCEQYDLFSDEKALEKERQLQSAMLSIRGKYGGRSIFKCLDLKEEATALERFHQIGGHRA